MKMKKTVKVRGFLSRAVVKGERASICCDDGVHYLTSKVVDVRNDNATGIEIETLNTIYKVTYIPDDELVEAV